MAEHRLLARDVRTRTTLVASVVVAGALVVGATVLLLLLRDRLVSAETSAAALRSRDIATLVEDDEVPDDLSFPGEESGFSQVVAADGSVVAASENIDGEPALSTLRPTDGDSAEQIVGGLDAGDATGRFAISVRSVESEDGPLTVITGSSLRDIDETWMAVALFLVVGIPLLVALVALLTRKVVDRALAPVEAIRRQVGDITESGLDKRVPEPGTGDEIDRLAASMNSMLARLEASAARQRRFVADASHELRSPLASARTTLEVSQRHRDDPAAVLASIDDALIDHDRLDQLLENLLTLARLDDPSGAGSMAVVDLGAVATDVLSNSRDARLGQVVVNGDTRVLGRRIHLERLVTNLIDNALKHCTDAVSLTVTGDRDEVVMVVEDDGPGIPTEERERVFERFVRLDEARTAERGTGLGLAIVREIALEHRGSAAITESPLGGAAVMVKLPPAHASAPGRATHRLQVASEQAQ